LIGLDSKIKSRLALTEIGFHNWHNSLNMLNQLEFSQLKSYDKLAKSTNLDQNIKETLIFITPHFKNTINLKQNKQTKGK